MVLAYKAFDPDLSCTSRGNRFEYQPGIWNEEPKADCAHNGFHCAENPLDCLNYYPNWKETVYYLVLAGGDIDEDAYDSRISCTRLKLVKRLNLEEFIAHSLRYLCEHPQMKMNCHVYWDKAAASQGFAIVRGKNPVAKGKIGDVLGFVKEYPQSSKIVEAGLHIVDGIHILADTWYDVSGKCSN